MPKFAAIDTKFILALAGGEPDAEATLDYLHKTGFIPIVTETVIEQLGELVESSEPTARDVAKYAARWMTSWGVLEVQNINIANGAAQVHAEKLLEQGLIPEATTIEAEILVEAACHGSELLVTFSQPLLDAPSTPLNLALMENHLHQVTIIIASPDLIARRLEKLNPIRSSVQAQSLAG
jgi:hypothetical protein